MLLLALSIFSSCKKESDEISFEFQITVEDFYSSSPVEGVTVKAHTKGVSSGTYNNTFQLQSSEITNGSGLVTFDIPYGGIEVIKLSIEKDGYFNQVIEYNPDGFSTATTNVLTLSFKKQGIISIRIRNTSPISAFDNITFNTLNSDCEDCVQFNSLSLTGTSVDTTLTGTVASNRHYKYQYIVTKSGVANNFLDSTFCDNDTTFVNINY